MGHAIHGEKYMLNIEQESTELLAKVISEFSREKKITPNMLSEVIQTIMTSYLYGKADGLSEYAWWKDGVQYVGTCGTTLREALESLYEK